MAFVFRAVDEVGATLNAALVVMGDKLGLLPRAGRRRPLTPAELAERTGTAERYVREWLNAQAAGGYVEYDPRRPLHAPARAGGRADRRGQPRVPARVLPDRAGHRARLAADRRGRPQRRRPRLARAQHRRPRGLRAVLPPGLQREPRPRVAPRARRRRREARARRQRRRRRLRPRRLDDPHGAGVPRPRRSSARTTTPPRSRPPARAQEAGVADRSEFEVAPAPTASRHRATTS